MRLSRNFGSNPRPSLGLLLLTVGAALACSAAGGGNDGGKGGSTSSQAGSDSKGGGQSETGGKSNTGGGGPVIVVPGEGGSCDGPCVQDQVVCGDGVLQVAGEECDDGNETASDGCSDTCAVEDGYVCPVPGAMCRAAECGDGVLAGTELCDDGNTIASDGCSETCTFETNYACLTPGTPCAPTDCGNGRVEGSEACDDGNHYLGDGCSIYCEKEPSCAPPAPCTSECGDGIKLGDEACDDANTRDGDGCSAACEVEPGWSCTEMVGGDLQIPIVYRDFKAFVDGGHVDFQWSANDPIDRTPKQDIWVRTTLGTAADATPDGTSLLGRPVFKWYAQCDGSACTDIPPSVGVTQPTDTLPAAQCNGIKNDATGPRMITTDGRNVYFCGYGSRDFNAFSQWYLDVDGVNQTILDTLTLTKDASGVFSYDNTSFFPVDGKGFGDYGTTNHNFHFTSEVRYWFQYQAAKNATLSFNGDDDVWVFVNGKLTVDISGTHGRTLDSVTVNAATTDIEGELLNLTEGGVYEIVVFQAERNTSASTYGLALDDFELTRSTCHSTCGDGIVTLDEACDDGTNDGSYGTCNPDCSRAAFCGDGRVDGEEGCDDTNYKNLDGCSAACQREKIK
jgi:fibro-slime domain-containing protein